MTHHKLQLSEWSAATKVIPFPCSKRVGKIRRVVEVLAKKSESPKDAANYWKRILADLERQMTNAGVKPDQIEAELSEFTTACRCASQWPTAKGRFPDDAS